MTWECRECTALYAPGAPACPQCRTNDPIREDEQLEKERAEMAKIHVDREPTNDNPETPDAAEVAETSTEGATTTEEAPEPAADESKPRPTRKSTRG